MNANEVKKGQKVTTSGFPGVIVEVCEWSRGVSSSGKEGVMVEVRLGNSGVVCVSCHSVELAPVQS